MLNITCKTVLRQAVQDCVGWDCANWFTEPVDRTAIERGSLNKSSAIQQNLWYSKKRPLDNVKEKLETVVEEKGNIGCE